MNTLLIKNPEKYKYYTPIDDIIKLNFHYHSFQEKSFLEYICVSLQDKYLLLLKSKNVFYYKKDKLELIYKLIEQIPDTKPSSYEIAYYLEIANLLCFYTNVDLVKFFYEKQPTIFQKDISFTYNFKNDYNLMKSALDANNFSIIEFLAVQAGHSFFCNFQNFNMVKFNREKRDILKNIIRADNIVKYLHYNESDIDNYFSLFTDTEIIVLLIEQIIGTLSEDTKKKNKLLENIFNHYLIGNINSKVIKFIFNNKYYQENIFSFMTYNDYTFDIKRMIEESYYGYPKLTYKNKVQLTKSIYYIINYIKLHTFSWEEFKKEAFSITEYDYNNSILSLLVKLPNIIPILKLLEIKDIQYIYNKDEILINLTRYGEYKTILYFYEEIENLYTFEKILDNSLCNRDIRSSKLVLEIIRKKKLIPYLSYCDLDLRFIILDSISNDNKLKKLKLISQNLNTKKAKDILLQKLVNISNIEIKKWFFKKYFQDIFYNKNTSEKELNLLLSTVLIENNMEFFQYFIKRVSKFYNFYNLLIIALKRYPNWYNPFIQELLNYTTPLLEQSLDIKTNIIHAIKDLRLYSVYEENTMKNFDIQEKYNKLVKYFVENGLQFDMMLYYQQSFITYILRNGNIRFFKALIINQVPMKSVFNFFKERYYHLYFNYNYRRYYEEFGIVRGWIKLYYLIKRLEFQKKYRNKKQHRNLYYSSMVDMIARPPSDKPVLQKGGRLFYQDLDEMDTLLEEETIQFTKAVHIEPIQLLKFLSTELYIAQKVDGLLRQSISEFYPPLQDLKFELVKLDGEYIEELDITLIFGVRAHQNKYSSFWEDYYELKNEHPVARNIPIQNSIILESDSEEEIKNKFIQEVLEIIRFSKNNINQKNKWWPKPIYQIPNQNDARKLEILQILQEHQYKLYLNNSISNHKPTDNYIPMDGIILMNDNKELIYKLKPKHYMTADLSRDNKIFRCGWHNKEWVTQEERLDKKYPNPPTIVRKLEQYHKNPWKLSDLEKYINDFTYYQKNTIYDSHIREFIQTCKNYTNRILEKEITLYNKNNTVLDIGCGYSQNYLWKHPDIKIDGLDNDFKLVNHSQNHNKKKYYQDISLPWNKETNTDIIQEFYQKKYNINSTDSIKQYQYITSLMSFHNVFRNSIGFSNLMLEINKRTSQDVKMMISFLDRDTLFLDNTKLEFPDGSFMKLKNKQELTYYYSWRHHLPVTEPIMSGLELTEKMLEVGWKQEQKNILNGEEINKQNPWQKVLSSFQILVFIKM